MKKAFLLFIISPVAVLLINACTNPERMKETVNSNTAKISIMKEIFGKTGRKDVSLYTLRNKNGITVKITNYGAIITSIQVPDKAGNMGDIVLGYDSLEQYVANNPYFGAIVGRYANRIAKGQFIIDDKTYYLAKNNGNNSLHGGIRGFDKVLWDAVERSDSTKAILTLSYLSKAGEEGFPGNLSVTVTYTLDNNDELKTEIGASTDQPTPVNLCNHSYFNLAMADTSILGHLLTLHADRYTVVNDELIPTGELRPVKGTPMDFSTPFVIGARIDEVTGGYDHNYVLVKKPGELSLAAVLEEPNSGRILEIHTTQPGVQFYSGNFLDGTVTGKGGKIYKKHYGLCLETQHFPDSPNHPAFPNTILRPGDIFSEVTIYKFMVKK